MVWRRRRRSGAMHEQEGNQGLPQEVRDPTPAATTGASSTSASTDGESTDGGVTSVRSQWRLLLHWFADNTFVPNWLPAHWRRPIASYILAVTLEVTAAFL